MNWTELSIITTTEAVEATANILMNQGATGVQIEDSADFTASKIGQYGELFDPAEIPHLLSGAKVSAYFPETVYIPELLPILNAQMSALADYGINATPYKIEQQAIAEADWATVWKQYYHPVPITRYITILPDWETYTPKNTAESVIRLDPGMAFGTGTHPTTRLSLQALEIVIRNQKKMIDVGTGSGVLSFAAAKLGVEQIYAYDLDEVAVQVSKDNLALNPDIKNVKIDIADLLNGVTVKAELIVANILAEILLPLIPTVRKNLLPNGTLILAGIIADKHQVILDQLAKSDFQVTETLQAEGWVTLIAKRSEDLN